MRRSSSGSKRTINRPIKDGLTLNNLPPPPLKQGLFLTCECVTRSQCGSALRSCKDGEDNLCLHYRTLAVSHQRPLEIWITAGTVYLLSPKPQHFISPFLQSAFTDKIKLLRASVLMEISYLLPRWKAFGTRCSFNTRWTSSCCAISEDLKTWKPCVGFTWLEIVLLNMLGVWWMCEKQGWFFCSTKTPPLLGVFWAGGGVHSAQPITHVLMGFYEYSAAWLHPYGSLMCLYLLLTSALGAAVLLKDYKVLETEGQHTRDDRVSP